MGKDTALKTVEVIGNSESNAGILAQRDKETALHDLTLDSVFQPKGNKNGPYHLKLYLMESRLAMEITDKDGAALPGFVLSVKPYKRLIQDYFMIVRSYDQALSEGKPSRIEAIDMGRRGLHNEGAELLQDRLAGKISIDHDTARRLFTLICVLHEGKALQWR